MALWAPPPEEGSGKKRWQPRSHWSHRMILASWCPPLQSSQFSVKMLSGTLMPAEPGCTYTSRCKLRSPLPPRMAAMQRQLTW